jgi:hypothetical protein
MMEGSGFRNQVIGHNSQSGLPDQVLYFFVLSDIY